MRLAGFSAIFGLALCGAPAFGQSTPVQSSDEIFVQLWSDHLTICGEVIADPDAPLDARSRPSWARGSAFWATEDRTLIEIAHVSQAPETVQSDAWWGDVELNVSALGYSLYCSVEFFTLGPVLSDIEAVELGIRNLVQLSPGLSISGGRAPLVSGSDPQDAAIPVRLVVSGAFPDFPEVSTSMLISEAAISLTVVASWERET